MRLRMLETRRGSEDARTVKRYHKGCVYEVAQSLAASFVRQGCAERVDDKTPETIVNEVIEQNKMAAVSHA